MKRFIPDWFIGGLTGMILLAWMKPGLGMESQPLNLGRIIDVGIVLIFFFYGLKLDPEKLKQGVSNWRMHLSIQLITFLFFPLLVLPFYPLVKNSELEILWLGMLFLAALPSTVSSSVVMVSIARGNIPGAIFNATISGIAGIFMTPFWMGLFMTTVGGKFDFGPVLLQLFIQIILPVIAGLILHHWVAGWIGKYGKQLGNFDKTIILLIVYESFSASYLNGLFQLVSWGRLLALSLIVVAMFFTVLSFTRQLAGWLKFSRADRITLQFAGSKKSLVHGSVFLAILFGGMHGTGLLLLPIMIYHAFQLFYVSILARREAINSESTP